LSHRLKHVGTVLVANWALKLLALALAALTFFAIRGATSFEERYEVPVEVKVEPGIAILDQKPRTVEIVVRGSREDLARLDESRMKASLRCRATDPRGAERLLVGRRHLEGLAGVRVERIRPAVVMVTFDREAEKRVPVARPTLTGEPLLGAVEGIEYEPRFVTVRGPKRRLTIEEIYTEPINVADKVDSFSRTVRLLPPGDTWVSRIEPSEISVRVRIAKRTVSRTLPRIRVLALVPPDAAWQVTVEPAWVDVTLEGGAETMESLTNDVVRVWVDCRDLDADTVYELPVDVHLPAGVDVKSMAAPSSVKVVAERRDTRAREPGR
jgi:YbbR domain-containing protein